MNVCTRTADLDTKIKITAYSDCQGYIRLQLSNCQPMKMLPRTVCVCVCTSCIHMRVFSWCCKPTVTSQQNMYYILSSANNINILTWFDVSTAPCLSPLTKASSFLEWAMWIQDWIFATQKTLQFNFSYHCQVTNNTITT